MHPTQPKREEDLAEHVEMWQDKMRRLKAHGDEVFKMAPVHKVSAFRMLMTSKAKEYFDQWEADRDNTDPAKLYEELLTKVKDYSRKRKLDSSAKEKMQHGGDPTNVRVVGGWIWNDDTGGGYDQGGVVYACGFKGEGKSKRKGKGDCYCYTCGSPGHYSRERPYPQKGKSKGDGFQGECYKATRLIPQGSAKKAKKEERRKEKETVTKGKAKD
jgi:hypothetical protein